MNVFLTVFAAFNIFLFPASALSANEAKPAKVLEAKLPVKNEISHTVKVGESFSDIATNYYGASEHWTTIWNDNSKIENPSIINEGQSIKLRIQKPKEPEKLKPELEKRIIALSSIRENQVQNTTPSINPILQNGPLNEAQMRFLGKCESGMTADRNSGNGYYGAFQFSEGTWNHMNTRYARADIAPLEEQKNAVQRLVSQSSIFGQFPECSRRMRAQGLI